jgi:hypothetical protein
MRDQNILSPEMKLLPSLLQYQQETQVFQPYLVAIGYGHFFHQWRVRAGLFKQNFKPVFEHSINNVQGMTECFT